MIFHRKQDFCSYKIVLIKKECSRIELCLFFEQTHEKKKIIIFNAQPSCANEASVAYLSPCRKLWTTGDGIVLFLICKKLVLNGCSSLKTKHFDSIFSRMVEEIFIFDLNNGLGIFIQLFAWKYANTPLFSGWKQRVVHKKGTRVYTHTWMYSQSERNKNWRSLFLQSFLKGNLYERNKWFLILGINP